MTYLKWHFQDKQTLTISHIFLHLGNSQPKMSYDHDDLPQFCKDLEEQDTDKFIYIWAVPMGLLVLCNICGCKSLSVNSFILFFVIYSGGIFSALVITKCGFAKTATVALAVAMAMAGAAWILSW